MDLSDLKRTLDLIICNSKFVQTFKLDNEVQGARKLQEVKIEGPKILPQACEARHFYYVHKNRCMGKFFQAFNLLHFCSRISNKVA